MNIMKYESLNMPQQMWVYDVPSFDSLIMNIMNH
jgi:hypothetical protein